MRKFLIVAEIVAVIAVFALAGGWFYFRTAPDAKAIQGALSKIPLPPGTTDFTLSGDERDRYFSVSAVYPSGSPTVQEIMDFYQAYFVEKGWNSYFPEDEPIDGMLDYGLDRISMNVTADNLGGQIYLYVIYRSDPYTHEEFSALVEESASPDALTLVRKVLETYAGLTSYKDTGTLEKSYDDGNLSTQATFTTAFRAPDKLRFSYVGGGNTFNPSGYELSMQGETVHSMADFDDAPEVGNDVYLAISGLYGVSSTTSGNIPELLLQLQEESVLFHLAHLTVIEEASLDDGTVCMQLQGSDFNGEETTLWIGKSDQLIRRIESRTDSENWSIITYQPEVNIEIADEVFEFSPPATTQ